MNERIKELAKQAGFNGFETLDERNQKFAELIVKDCGQFTDPVTRNLMMKYFGIEE